MAGTPRSVLHLTSILPPGASWTATGIGRTHLPVTLTAKGRLAESNAELIARVASIAAQTGREVATPDQAREIVGIAGGGG